MLTLTENASAVVKELAGEPAPGGLRISSAGPDSPSLQVTHAAEPLAGDQVVQQGGATVYLDGPASRELDDKVLDAVVGPAGQVQFSLSLQA